jgi:hypothetical protein
MLPPPSYELDPTSVDWIVQVVHLSGSDTSEPILANQLGELSMCCFFIVTSVEGQNVEHVHSAKFTFFDT